MWCQAQLPALRGRRRVLHSIPVPIRVGHPYSDQGSQDTSLALGERCLQMQDRPSAVCDAHDNAMAESIFASLEGELIERNSFQSKAQDRTVVFTWMGDG